MRKISIEFAKELLDRIPKECVKSIEIINAKWDSEEVYISRWRKIEKVRYHEDRHYYKTDPVNYLEVLENNLNGFSELGRIHYIRVNKKFKQLPYLAIRLHKLKNYDILKSGKNKLNIYVWNEGDEEQSQFDEIKEYILSDRKIAQTDTYYNFELNK